jgi:serine/threonine protein kinase
VVHGDLKTANVLLKGSTRDARGVTCKITDFGLSRVLDVEATHISTGTYGESAGAMALPQSVMSDAQLLCLQAALKFVLWV